ncbi:family 16 glycosylhydrolase [Mucilaginibacter lutimaris]|uniref:Family 16 glycosylhydrolase n=1 Tax=Mucilaginibacter lutimaris TaxID=931629 RepID=A0ABW2ZJ26_9SPHI
MAITAAVALAASCSSVKQAPAASNTNGNVIFFDDFSENKIDRTKWSPIVTGFHVNNELQAYVDSSATAYIENGALVLKPQFSTNFKTFDNQQFDFISGRLVTKGKFDFTYGTAEARIKVTAGDGLWPAWWMLGNGMWPNDGEIDIMEFIGEADWVSAAVHGPGYSGETPFVNRLYMDKSHDATQWHIYGVEWTPDALNFKYDGVLMFRVTRKMAEHYGKWVFDNKQHLILNFAVGGIYPFKINQIKKPYYGLSEASLNKIKKGEAKMWVDWVKVTQNK